MRARTLMILTVLLLGVACEKALNPLATTDAVVSVSIQPRVDTLHVGDSLQLSATVVMSNNRPPSAVRWASTNATVAPVSSQGMVKGLAVGAASIDAQSGSKRDSSAVIVVATAPPPPVPVAAVTVTPAAATITVGGTQLLTATPKDTAGNPLTGRVVTWSSSATPVATVNGGGSVAAVAVGTVTITATSEGKSGTAAITVSPVPVASVTVAPAAAAITVGGTQLLTATPKDSAGTPLTGRVVAWSSNATTVVTVNGSGTVTGTGAGTATITATSEGKSGTATITVTQVPVASVTVAPAAASIAVGGTQLLTATPKDAAGNPLTGRVVTWSSNTTTVATVNGSGTVAGVAVGSATITATSEGKSGTATITVMQVPVASVTVWPTAVTIAVGGVQLLTATPKDSAGNPLTGRVVTWSSNAVTVATVNGSGTVSAVAIGTATITATSEGKSGTAAITVVVASACTPTFGSFGVGVWPPACYHPFDTAAWINRLLPATPQLDPNSAAIAAALNSHGSPGDKGAGLANDYDHPIYWSKASDPVYTMTGCGYSGALNGTTIHALKGMLPGGGSDGHIVVMDQSTNMEWDFWQAVVNDAALTIGGHSCGGLSLSGDGRVSMGDGGNAANTGLYTGQIRAVELMAGVINHPIAVDVSCTNGTYVYPATGTALTCGGANEPADGQLFQLTYSDAEIDALPVAAWKKVVLHAMHQYGFYADDTYGTSEGHSFDLHFESDKMYQAYGYEDPFVTYAKQYLGQDIVLSGGVYYYQIGPNVDWTRIQVVKPCVIQHTC